jgi:hypothetical protein
MKIVVFPDHNTQIHPQAKEKHERVKISVECEVIDDVQDGRDGCRDDGVSSDDPCFVTLKSKRESLIISISQLSLAIGGMGLVRTDLQCLEGCSPSADSAITVTVTVRR